MRTAFTSSMARVIAAGFALFLMGFGQAAFGQGAAIWASAGYGCSGCHSTTSAPRPNGASSTEVLLAAQNGGMNPSPTYTQMSAQDRIDLAAYLESQNGNPSSNRPLTVPYNGSNSVDFSDATSDISFGGAWSDFSRMARVTNGTKGSVPATTLSETVTYTATCGQVGADTFTVRASNAANSVRSSNRTVNVTISNATSAPTISSGATATGTTGVNATQYNITATPCATSYSASGLPPGLSVNASTGAIFGTPTVGGTFNATVFASGGGMTGNRAVTFTINLGTPTITGATINGGQGVALPPFAIATTSTNPGPNNFVIQSGTLPTGLMLDAATGVISGTPTIAVAPGDPSNPVVIRVTNSDGLTSGNGNFIFNIQANPPVVTGATVNGQTGTFLTTTISATNSPTSYSAAPIPAGLNFDSGTGVISGIPTAVVTGFLTTVSAANGAGPGNNATITFNIALGPPVITSPGTAGGSSALPFSYSITATNNPTSYGATGLPPGLTLNTGTGMISGVPTANGTFNATVSATNATATDTDPLVITIVDGTPVINSPDRANGTVGQPFSYTLTSMVNADRFDATGLPPGLTLLNSSGVISGTPTVGGVYVVNVSATNLAGTANGVLTITIAFIAPTAQGTTINVPFDTPTQIALPVAGAFTDIRIVQPPSHGTLSAPVPGTFTLTYTPTTGYSGPDSFTYFATGPGGNSPTVQVDIIVGTSAPVALTATMTVPLNTATSLDLAAFVKGSSITGVAVTTEPRHGTVAVDGLKVIYSPKLDFFGSDSFAYRAFGNAGTSPPAIVSVTVVGRPDPSKDPNVVGLIDSQVQTARRFARAQIGNYQRRMESLHFFGAGVGDGGPRPATSSAATPRASALPDKPVTAQGKPSEAGMAANAPSPLATAVSGALVGAATSGSLNIEASREGKDANVWIAGVASFGNREGSDEMAKQRFSTDGMSVGADKRFSDQLALGMGVGYARDHTDIGSDGTKSKSSGGSIAAYGSFHPSRNTYIDALLGYGTLDFDTDRWVVAADEFATGRRKGKQVFGSVAGGYEFRDKTLLISPYGRFDFSVDRLDQATESGAGLAALTYLEHKQTTTSLSAGLRVESQHETDFGAAQPRARIEYRRDFEDTRSASIAYADLFSGPTYSVTPAGTSRNSLLLGMGVDFLFRKGLRIGIDYQGERNSGSQNVQAVRLLVSQDLDFKGSPSWGWGSLPFENPIRVEAGVTYDDNVTRGRESSEILSDRSYLLSVGLDKEYRFGKNIRAVVTPLFTGEEFRRFSGLGHASGGIQGEMQYRGTADFDATTLAVIGRAVYDKYESNLRTGERYYLGLNARKSLTDRIDIFGEVGRNVRYGESAVFELKDYSARFNLDYSLGRNGSLYFSGEYRKGDIVSSGRSSLTNLALADVFVAEDAFEEGYFAYRFEGKTALGTIGYNYPLGPRDSLDFSWRYVQSKPDKRPSFDSGESIRYKVNQYSVIYLIRF